MPNKNLSVVVVNYRTERHLIDCIDSIQKNLNNPEIIVVNNDQADLAPFIGDFPGVILINRENKGFGSGANAGFQKAEGDIILFLNPDARIISKNIELVFAEFERDSHLAVLGPSVLLPTGKLQPWSAGHETGIFDIIRNNLNLSKSQSVWEHSQKRTADWVSGTAMFVRKKTFGELNGFDEEFFMYFEDMDLCKRMRSAGNRIMFFPEFKIEHAGGVSYTNSSAQKEDYYNAMERYFQKHRSKLEWWLVKIIRKLFY